MEEIKKHLYGFPAHDLGNKFVLITRQGIIKSFMSAVASLGMFRVESQWLYVTIISVSLSLIMTSLPISVN